MNKDVYYVPFEFGYTGEASLEIELSKSVENTIAYYLCEKNILISVDGRLLCRYTY